MRNIFKQKHPLLLIDLPPFASANYREFRAAASWAKETSKALMVVSVEKGRAVDEVWARELGVWTYLSEMTLQKDWELMFREARQALARQAMAYLDSSAQTS